MIIRFTLLTIALCLLYIPASARPLVADISTHNITIHSAFDGTDLILFGNRNKSGDIIVVVRGPDEAITVHKKERLFGIWVNRQKEQFSGVPFFYAMASSRPYESIRKSIYFDALQIGYLQAIHPFALTRTAAYGEEERARHEVFARALLREMRTLALYPTDVAPITFIGDTLFRTSIHFPDRTPTGTYSAEVYLFSDGELVGVHTTPIYVYKSGLDAFIYGLATQQPVLYGILAIALALLGGVTAIKLFDRN